MADDADYLLEPLRKAADFTLRRGRVRASQTPVLALAATAEQPLPRVLSRLEHEYALAAELDAAWAAVPLALTRRDGRPVLVLADPGGEPLDLVIMRAKGQPIELTSCLRIAIGLASALGQAHRQGLIHKDVKPANVLVDEAGRAWLTGFGVASRLPRERVSPVPPEVIAGSLAYMSPEQTGRMNRTIDTRSDLYSLGVTLYEMLTGVLPFAASEPLEWVHCHIARQPAAPAGIRAVPEPLSAITMRLLAKDAEQRYQTAAGLEADLGRCLAQWQAHGRIDPFPLGADDASDRLTIPETLYGREREVDVLLTAFERVVEQGTTELVLVSGYSGVGKSSVVNELHKVLVPPRGLFASGKFDQYKRDIPYSTLARAFQGLVRQFLSKSDAELDGWRETFGEALGLNGRLIVDLIPELGLIIGEPPAVADLPPQDARRRFQAVLRRFIGVFARTEHPLVLFLDDLQWLDAATLDLIEDLLTQDDVQHLLLIGAYRDNEVDAAHPLMRKLDAIRLAGAPVLDVVLAPLSHDHLVQLTADALRCQPNQAGPLVRLVHEKTGGNPFFAIQFLQALAEEGLLAFDHAQARWSWDLSCIRAKRYSDNVVDLMVAKLARLPADTSEALRLLACVGSHATVDLLATAAQAAPEQIHDSLGAAIRAGLTLRLEDGYAFQHDRIQEAAYSLVPEGLRAETHLRIGKLLAANTPADRREDAVFEIVNQLNRGAGLITADNEREQLAEFNLLAGRRAKASTAYASALKYFACGADLLPHTAWENRHDLMFALELSCAECEFLTSDLAAAETRLDMLSTRAASTVDLSGVACLRMDLYTTLDRGDRALAVGLDYLRPLGINWSPQPTDEEAQAEYERVWSQLRSRTIEELIDLPLTTDTASLATLDVLMKLWPAAMFTNVNLFALAMCLAVNLSLEHGHSDVSCTAYVQLGAIAGSRFGDYQAGLRFGRLGYDLVEQRGLKRFQARTYLLFGASILPWMKHVTIARDVLRLAFSSANERGDYAFAVASAGHLNANLLAASDPLIEVQREAERGLAFAQKIRFGLASDVFAIQLQTARMLRGLTQKFGLFDDEQFSELQITRRFAGNPNLSYAECLFWIRKLQGYVLAGDFTAAVDASLRLPHLSWTAQSALEMAGYHFYAALARAAHCDSASAEQRQQHLEALTAHYLEIENTARHCPENFANCAALVGAEIARLEGRDAEAMRLYEDAIRSAREHGFVQNQGLAYETAARFYRVRGFETFAEVYLRKARDCYLRWGADGKVQQLDRLYPQLEGREAWNAAALIGSPIQQHLDVTSIVKASQAVSSEIELPKLIERLMTIALQNAGADRGFLILPSNDEYLIEAEARATDDQVEVTMRQQPITQIACPESLIRYVIRTRESVILDDASKPNMFSEDDHLRDRQLRSILCLPLIKHRELAGILLLENTLTSHAFTPARIAILELLSAQAAISLENARLYADLELQVGLLHHLPVSAWTLNPDGTPDFVNQVWLDFSGQTLDFVRSHPEAWLTAVHPEDRGMAARRAREGVNAGQGFAFEARALRAKDGAYRRHLQKAVVLRDAEGKVLKFVGTATDIDDQKRAEEALSQAQADFAHVARIATLNAMTASIAHEVSQPLSGILTNANTGLRMLAAEPPDVAGAIGTARRTIRDANRATGVIARLRDMFAKKEPTMERVDLNAAARDVIALSGAELQGRRALLETDFADELPLVLGDRVQLQQVILNLLLNAADAMAEVEDRPRTIRVQTSRHDDGGAMLAVVDSGMGVNPHAIDQLFEAFYTTKADGMGVGLSICRSIVESHDGRLWAEANDGPGAAFSFHLPAASEAAGAPRQAGVSRE